MKTIVLKFTHGQQTTCYVDHNYELKVASDTISFTGQNTLGRSVRVLVYVNQLLSIEETI